MADKVSIPVSFDGHGYVARAPELSSPVVALSLSSLRKRIKAMLPERSVVVLNLDRLARKERGVAASRRTGGGRVSALKFPAIAGCRERRVWVAPPDAQALFCRRRHQPRRPPTAKIRPGRPAPAMGPGTGTPAGSTQIAPARCAGFLEHDWHLHPARLPVGLIQRQKATAIFWNCQLMLKHPQACVE